MVKKSILTVLMTGLIINTIPAQAGWFDWKKEELVERYSPVVNNIMYRLASCNSLQDLVHRRRTLVQCEDNTYTSLFQNAQREVGIKEEDILPIRTISRDDTENKLGYVATSTNDIKIIPENFDALPYGAKKVTALHEAYHHKYNDSLFKAWLGYQTGLSLLGSMTLSTTGLWGFIYSRGIKSRSAKAASYIGAPLITFVANAVAYKKFINFTGIEKSPSRYDWYKEFRADRDAVKQARCYKCIQDYRTIADQHQYLTKQELDVYIEHFKKEKALCKDHK